MTSKRKSLKTENDVKKMINNFTPNRISLRARQNLNRQGVSSSTNRQLPTVNNRVRKSIQNRGASSSTSTPITNRRPSPVRVSASVVNTMRNRASPKKYYGFKNVPINRNPLPQRVSVEPKHQMILGKIPTSRNNYNTYLKNVNRHTSSGEKKIHTSNFTIPIRVFTDGTNKKILLEKLYEFVFKPKLIDRKRAILQNNRNTRRTTRQNNINILRNVDLHRDQFVRFMEHYIDREHVETKPTNMTGEMVEVVIDDIKDLCNFIYIQKLDIVHDFTEKRLGNSDPSGRIVKYVNKNIFTFLEGVETLHVLHP